MACLSMVAAAVVEIIRLQVVANHNLQNSDPTAPGAPVVPMVRAAAAAGWCSSVVHLSCNAAVRLRAAQNIWW